MQIIVDDHTEMKYYKRCLEQINNKYSQDTEIDKCTIIDICDLCIDTLVRDFTNILDILGSLPKALQLCPGLCTIF